MNKHEFHCFYVFFYSDKPAIQIEEGCSEYTALVGNPVSIGATVTGVPPPTVTWRFIDQYAMTDENLKIGTNGDMNGIKISKSEFSHTGTYKITAANAVGRDEKTIKLKVLGYSKYPVISICFWPIALCCCRVLSMVNFLPTYIINSVIHLDRNKLINIL